MVCVLVLAASLCVGGCITPSARTRVVNPSFPVSPDEARIAIRAMQHDTRLFERPVVILSGYLDPGPGAAHAAELLREMTPDPSQVIVVPFFSLSRFDSCRARVIERVQARFPSDDPARTVAVDVIGVSMGGLIARDAAIASDDHHAGRVLRIERLFTIATPHRGADLAHLPTIDSRVVGMRPGSEFLLRLHEAAMAEAASGGAYPIVAYTRLDDEIVGEANTIPPRGELFWVPNEAWQFSHLQAQRDDRILADIARRLRGETPLTFSPAAALPSPSRAGRTE